MGDDDIRNYVNRQATEKPGKGLPTQMRVVPRGARPSRGAPGAREPQEPKDYEDFSATHLFCARCRQATPVREKVLLFLPDGDLHGYSCTVCGSSVGTRKVGR